MSGDGVGVVVPSVCSRSQDPAGRSGEGQREDHFTHKKTHLSGGHSAQRGNSIKATLHRGFKAFPDLLNHLYFIILLLLLDWAFAVC